MNEQFAVPAQLGRWPRHGLFVFVLVLVVCGLALLHQPASAEEQTETIPPGGTVPPPPHNLTAGLVRVVHGAPFSPVVADTAVDICQADDTAVAGFTGLVYLTETGYLPFAPGIYDWYVGEPGCVAEVVDIPPFTLFVDAALTIYILGDGVNQPITTVLSVDRAGLNRIQQLPLVFQSFQDAVP